MLVTPSRRAHTSGAKLQVQTGYALQSSSTEKNSTMSLAAEYKEFAMRGNVIAFAVGVVIGGECGSIAVLHREARACGGSLNACAAAAGGAAGGHPNSAGARRAHHRPGRHGEGIMRRPSLSTGVLSADPD